ncbi:MAG: hypothetical protein KDB68_03945 [Planctomycetes bacterium]|nr:hypothetical protein [Planctomycetota bacterium]MCA8935334.1 hypothetical protein [Planctomycetota bacterium]MCA8944968.1 hypothetical protein [Planctomycetota bacterium]
MRYPTTALALLTSIWLAAPAHACFFCEEGAANTAMFVLSFFGLFMLGMLFICIAYYKAGAFKSDHQLELRVLEAEGIEFTAGGKDDQ